MSLSEKRLPDGFSGQQLFVVPPEVFSAFRSHPLIQRMALTDAGAFPHAENHYRERREGIVETILLFYTTEHGHISLCNKYFLLDKNEVSSLPANEKGGRPL